MQINSTDVIAFALLVWSIVGIVIAVRGGKPILAAMDAWAKAMIANQQFVAAEKQAAYDSIPPTVLPVLTALVEQAMGLAKIALPAGSMASMTEADLEALIRKILDSAPASTTSAAPPLGSGAA